MEREVRYCTTEDGVRIAYCVEGEGPPLVVVAEFARVLFSPPSLSAVRGVRAAPWRRAHAHPL